MELAGLISYPLILLLYTSGKQIYDPSFGEGTNKGEKKIKYTNSDRSIFNKYLSPFYLYITYCCRTNVPGNQFLIQNI